MSTAIDRLYRTHDNPRTREERQIQEQADIIKHIVRSIEHTNRLDTEVEGVSDHMSLAVAHLVLAHKLLNQRLITTYGWDYQVDSGVFREQLSN